MNVWDAELFFFRQALSGDATDNIPGAKGIGDAKAEKYIKEWTEQYTDSPEINACIDLREWLWDNIVQIYLEKGWYGAPDERDLNLAEKIAIEQARLVKMQDYAGQLWTPPGQEDEKLEVQLDD